MGDGYRGIAESNDDPRTTQFQVVNALDFAILLAKDDLKAAK